MHVLPLTRLNKKANKKKGTILETQKNKTDEKENPS
jgi:hypothetical protein